MERWLRWLSSREPGVKFPAPIRELNLPVILVTNDLIPYLLVSKDIRLTKGAQTYMQAKLPYTHNGANHPSCPRKGTKVMRTKGKICPM